MTQQSERKPPEIVSEEDTSLTTIAQDSREDQRGVLPKEKGAEPTLDVKKFTLGSSTLGWCILLMFLCIVLSIWNPDNELLKSGFEAFKLIVMTILGYIFGSNNSQS